MAVAATVLSPWSMNQLSAPTANNLGFCHLGKSGTPGYFGAISYFFEKLHSACKILYNDYIRPTKMGEQEQYIADVTHGFLARISINGSYDWAAYMTL